jgi:opacity protein-like surface antigen
MKRRLFTFLALVTLAAPTICFATSPRPGPYVSGFVGAAFAPDTTAAPFDDRYEFDPSVNIGGTGGYDFGFLRVEGELSYKNAEIHAVEQEGVRYHNIDGRIGALAMMGNVFVDLRNPGPVTPYFGAGAGFAGIYISDVFGTDPSRARKDLNSSDSDAVFAYQFGGGLEIALTRRLSLDVGYRYFRTSKATLNSGDIETQLRFESHNAAVGVRMKF